MVEQQGRTPARAAGKREQAAQLAELRARRDELDAEQVERRKLEDAALGRYVAAEAKVRAVYDAAGKKVAALNRQVVALHEKAKADAADQEAAQAAALLELQKLGRSADELSQLTGVGVKKVRAMVREARGITKKPPVSAAEAAAAVSPERREEIAAAVQAHKAGAVGGIRKAGLGEVSP